MTPATSAPSKDAVFAPPLPREDARLYSLVKLALQGVNHRPIRQLSIECSDGVVTLRGPLPNFYQKQLAQTVVLEIEGVKGVENLTQVLY